MFWEKTVAKVDVPVDKYEASIMDDNSPVCDANADDYGEEDDGRGDGLCAYYETTPRLFEQLDIYELTYEIDTSCA